MKICKMKKRHYIIGIVSIVIFTLTFSFNISRPDLGRNNATINIKLMAQASLVKDNCDQHLEGYFCNTWISGDKDCVSGGEVDTYCDD